MPNRSFGMQSVALLLCVAMMACGVDQVLATINVVIQTASAISVAVGNVSPDDAERIAKLSKIATDGLDVITQDYNAFKASGAATDLDKIRAAVKVLSDNLKNELAASHISNPATVLRVAAWVALVTGTLNAVLAALPAKAGGKLKLSGPLPSAKDVKLQWSSGVCQGDKTCAALVK